MDLEAFDNLEQMLEGLRHS